ncbi:unnamed protein product [Cunninghamella echinulata]
MINSEQMDSHIIKSEPVDFNSSVSTLNTISTSNMSTSSINTTNPGSIANNASSSSSSSSSSSILMNSIANQSLVSLLPEFATHLPTTTTTTTTTTNDMIESNIADSPNSALPSPVSDIDPNEPNWHSTTSLDMQTTHPLQHHPSLEMNSSTTNANIDASNPHSNNNNINNITTANATTTTANMMDIVHETDSLTDEDMDGNSTNSSNNNNGDGGGGINSLLRTYDALPSNIQDYLIFQLLRRSPMASLRFSSDLIMQALRTDFISVLPRQLSQYILLYLDAKSLCRAAGVSKYWKKVIDGDSQLWKAKIIEAGFTVTTNEVESYRTSSSLSSLSLAAPIKTEIITPISSSSSSSSIPIHFNNNNNNNNNNNEQQSNHPSTTTTSSPSPTSITSPYLSSIKEMIHDGVYNSFLDKPLFDHSLLSATSEHSLSYHYHQQQKMTSSNLNNNNNNNNLQQHNDFEWQPDFDHPYKKIYRRHHIMRLNWKRNRAEKKQITGSGEVVTCLQFDDDKIIIGFDNCNIHIYDIKTGELRRVLKEHEGGVWALQYVGNTLVTGSTDRTLRVWDIERGVCRYVFRGHGSTVRCLYIVMPTPVQVGPGKHDVVIQPSQPLIVSGSRDSFLRVWKLPYLSTRHSQQQKQFQDSSHNVFDRQYNANSNVLQHPLGPTTSSTTTTSHLSSYTQQQFFQNQQKTQEHGYNPFFIHLLQGHSQSVRALSAHGNTLVSGSYDTTVKVWDLEKGKLRHTLEGHQQKVYSVAIDAQHNRCISGSLDSTIRIWNLADGSCERVLRGHTILVGLLGLTERYLVSAAADATLRIWSSESGECQHVLSGHKGAITSFQHDDYKVISGSEGGLKMWDIKTGQLLHDIITDINGVWRVAFDERRCVAAVKSDDITRIEILDYGAIIEDE